MKTFLLGTIFFFAMNAGATPMSTPEFIMRFVHKTNDRLEKTNIERAMNGDRPYCAQLSDEQANVIAGLFVMNSGARPDQKVYRGLHQMTAGQFVGIIAENLGCYPTTWLPGKSSFGGFFFSTKAYVMDHFLVRKSLEDLAGRRFEDSESLASVVSR